MSLSNDTLKAIRRIQAGHADPVSRIRVGPREQQLLLASSHLYYFELRGLGR
jgi:hypothetical protein